MCIENKWVKIWLILVVLSTSIMLISNSVSIRRKELLNKEDKTVYNDAITASKTVAGIAILVWSLLIIYISRMAYTKSISRTKGVLYGIGIFLLLITSNIVLLGSTTVIKDGDEKRVADTCLGLGLFNLLLCVGYGWYSVYSSNKKTA